MKPIHYGRNLFANFVDVENDQDDSTWMRIFVKEVRASIRHGVSVLWALSPTKIWLECFLQVLFLMII